MPKTDTPRSGAFHRATTTLPIAGVAVALLALSACSSSTPAGGSSGGSAKSAVAAPVSDGVAKPPFEGRPYADATAVFAPSEEGKKRPVPCELLGATERKDLAGVDLPRLEIATTTNEWTCTFTTTTAGSSDPTVIVHVRPAMDGGADLYKVVSAVAKDDKASAATKAAAEPLAKTLAAGELTSPKVCAALTGAVAAGLGSDGAVQADKGATRMSCVGTYLVSTGTTADGKADGVAAAHKTVVERLTPLAAALPKTR